MLNAGVYALSPDIEVTTEAVQTSDWTTIDGATSATIQVRFICAGGGTECRAFIQTSYKPQPISGAGRA